MRNKRLLISLHDRCQYKCGFCMYQDTRPLGAKEAMNLKSWFDVLSVAYGKGFRVLEIGGRGEPTLCSAFIKIVAKAHKIGYQVELLSNGLNDKVIIKVLPMIRRLTINLNALNDEDLVKIHRPKAGLSFNSCAGRIKNVIRNAAAINPAIALKINYVMTKNSFKKAFLFPEEVNRLFGPKLGFPRHLNVSFQLMHDYMTDTSSLAFNYRELQKLLSCAYLNSRRPYLRAHTNLMEFIAKIERLMGRLKLVTRGSGRASDRHSEAALYTCMVHHHVLFVDSNGDCFGCYNPFRVVNGLPVHRDQLYLGNIKEKEFERIVGRAQRLNPRIDTFKPYWRLCLSCEAVSL